MKPWLRRLVLAVLWIGVGALVAGIAGAIMGTHGGWMLPFGVGAVAAVLILVMYGTGRVGSYGSASGGATAATVAGRSALSPVLVAVCVIVGFAGSMLLVLGGPQRAVIAVSEIPQRISGQVHGLWDSAMLEHDLDTSSEQLKGRDLDYLLILEDFVAIDARSETHEGGIDYYVLRGGSLDLSRTGIVSGESGRFRLDDVDAGGIRSAVAQVSADDPETQIRSVGVKSSRSGLIVKIYIKGEYEDTERVFDAKTGEEILED